MKKGFTLVELLGVIFIIGVIALITVPSFTATINQARQKTYDKQVDMIETAAKEWGVDNIDLLPEEDSSSGKVISLGTLIEAGKIQNSTIQDPRTKDEMKGCVVVKYNSEYQQYEYKYSDNEEVCAGMNQKLCRPATQATLGNVPSGNYEYGDEYICELGDGVERRFFVLENADNVSLIMNENLDIYIDTGLSEAEEELISNTKNWSKLNSAQIKLPSAGQIVKAAGHSESILSQVYEIPNLPTWLGGTEEEANYWTSSKINDNEGWDVWYENKYEPYIVLAQYEWEKGGSVRPVITISKDNL